MKAPKFKDFITEEKEDQYRLVILSHDDADDPNKTGDLIREKAKKLGIKVLLAEFIGAYVSEENDKLYLNSFPVERVVQLQNLILKKILFTRNHLRLMLKIQS